MDLEDLVTLLEDEVGILNGEIKTILLDVRTAFLAQYNPFTIAALPPQAEPQRFEPAGDDVISPEPVTPVFTKPNVRSMEPVVSETTTIVQSKRTPRAPRFEMNTLAMLMAWTQGNMARLNLTEMGSLLALARYGGVIEAELEHILHKIAGHFEHRVDPRTGEARFKAPATISEYLLALHELNSVLNEEDELAFRWLRNAA